MPLPLPLTLPSNPRADVDGDIDDADVEFETAVAAVPGLFLFTLPFWKCPRPLGFGLLTTVPLMVGMELEVGDTFDDVLPIFDGTCILLLTPMTVRPLPLELDLDRVREVLLLKFSVLLKTSIFRVLVRLACLTCLACSSRGRYFSVRLDERTSERET